MPDKILAAEFTTGPEIKEKGKKKQKKRQQKWIGLLVGLALLLTTQQFKKK
jgi:hypothetical protein